MSIPPGWYDGGVAGEQRWWDGSAWGPQIRVVPKPGIQWSGSADGSIVAGILCIVLGLSVVGVTFFALLSGAVHVVIFGSVAVVGITAFAVLAFANAAGLKRQQAARTHPRP